MSFRRDDFHNSRAYEADPPMPARSRLSSALAWVKLQFDKLLRSGASSSISAITPLGGDEGPYSLLGSDGHVRPSDRQESIVFPMADRAPGIQTRLRPARSDGMRRHERRAEG